MSATARYLQFHDGPSQEDLRLLNGKEATFIGTVTQGEDREAVMYAVQTRLRIRDSFMFYATNGTRTYQVEAVVANSTSLFDKGERLVFEYDAMAQQSEEIYLT